LIPIDLAKNILRLYQDGRLRSSRGFALTLEGALIIEREKSIELFSENGALSKSVGTLKNLIGEN